MLEALDFGRERALTVALLCLAFTAGVLSCLCFLAFAKFRGWDK